MRLQNGWLTMKLSGSLGLINQEYIILITPRLMAWGVTIV